MRARGGPLLLAAVLPAACGGGAGQDRPSCLLVTLDTTRVDAVGAYVEARTPHLDRLAAEGVTFDRAYTSAPLTLPAHATLLSGLYPLRHGVRDNGLAALPDAATTLAEAARDQGYATGAFVAAVVLDAAFGLDQGFDVYEGPAPDAKPPERPADEVVDAALAWLEAQERGRPFLLWVHLYDPHTPYAPPADLDGATPRQKYDGEVSFADRELGRLLARLRERGAYDDTLVVVAADHGEGFGEHGEEGHSVHVWDTVMRVPLILRPPASRPGRFAPGARSDEVVGLADLAPTVAAALDLRLPADLDGVDVWSAPPPPDHGVYFESFYGYFAFGWSPLTGWVDRDGKYVHATEPRFFDVAADPDERRDLFAEDDERVRRHRRRIAQLAQRPALAAEDGAAADAELLAGIRGLGYASAGGGEVTFPHPLEDTGLPTPEAMEPYYERALEGVELGKRGELPRAEAIFREVLAKNPQNWFVLDHLATCLFQTERYAEAADTLRRIALGSPGQPPEIWFKLGLAEETAGRTDAAIEAYARSAELGPRRATLEALVRLLRARGDAQRAARYERELAELRRNG